MLADVTEIVMDKLLLAAIDYKINYYSYLFSKTCHAKIPKVFRMLLVNFYMLLIYISIFHEIIQWRGLRMEIIGVITHISPALPLKT